MGAGRGEGVWCDRGLVEGRGTFSVFISTEPDMAEPISARARVTGPAVPVGQPSLLALAKCVSCTKHTEKYITVMASFPSLLSQVEGLIVWPPCYPCMLLVP